MRAIQSSGRMISPENGQGHSVVPNKRPTEIVVRNNVRPPPLIRHCVKKNYSHVLGSAAPIILKNRHRWSKVAGVMHNVKARLTRKRCSPVSIPRIMLSANITNKLYIEKLKVSSASNTNPSFCPLRVSSPSSNARCNPGLVYVVHRVRREP